MPTDSYVQPDADGLFTIKHKWKAVGRHLRHWFECSKCGYTFLVVDGDLHRPIPIPPTCPKCGRSFIFVGRKRGLYSLDERG